MMNDPASYGPMAGILAMALATYLTRVIGFWLMGHVPMTARVRRMLERPFGSVRWKEDTPDRAANEVLPVVATAAGSST